MNQPALSTDNISNLLVSVSRQQPACREREPDPTVLKIMERDQTIANEFKLPQGLKEVESKKLLFRFNDLAPAAQLKFASILKDDSSIWTVHKAAADGGIKMEDILGSLIIINPIIAQNGWRNFGRGSSFSRWLEHKLSHLIYHANRKYRNHDQINYLVGRTHENWQEKYAKL